MLNQKIFADNFFHYRYVEFNASDSRSKKLLDKVLGKIFKDNCFFSYFSLHFVLIL